MVLILSISLSSSVKCLSAEPKDSVMIAGYVYDYEVDKRPKFVTQEDTGTKITIAEYLIPIIYGGFDLMAQIPEYKGDNKPFITTIRAEIYINSNGKVEIVNLKFSPTSEAPELEAYIIEKLTTDNVLWDTGEKDNKKVNMILQVPIHVNLY